MYSAKYLLIHWNKVNVSQVMTEYVLNNQMVSVHRENDFQTVMAIKWFVSWNPPPRVCAACKTSNNNTKHRHRFV